MLKVWWPYLTLPLGSAVPITDCWNLNQHSALQMCARACVRIIVHYCRTQHNTDTFLIIIPLILWTVIISSYNFPSSDCTAVSVETEMPSFAAVVTCTHLAARRSSFCGRDSLRAERTMNADVEQRLQQNMQTTHVIVSIRQSNGLVHLLLTTQRERYLPTHTDTHTHTHAHNVLYRVT